MNKVMNVRLSDVLMDHIIEKAKERGLHSSNYVRMLIVQDLEYYKGLNE